MPAAHATPQRNIYTVPSYKVESDHDFEPDEEWKHLLRKRIEENMKEMVQEAKDLRDAELKKAPVSEINRIRLETDYKNSMSNLMKMASEQFNIELGKEVNQRKLVAGKPVNEEWSAYVRDEQQNIMNTFKPRSDNQSPITVTSDDRFRRPSHTEGPAQSEREKSALTSRSSADMQNTPSRDRNRDEPSATLRRQPTVQSQRPTAPESPLPPASSDRVDDHDASSQSSSPPRPRRPSVRRDSKSSAKTSGLANPNSSQTSNPPARSDSVRSTLSTTRSPTKRGSRKLSVGAASSVSTTDPSPADDPQRSSFLSAPASVSSKPTTNSNIHHNTNLGRRGSITSIRSSGSGGSGASIRGLHTATEAIPERDDDHLEEVDSNAVKSRSKEKDKDKEKRPRRRNSKLSPIDASVAPRHDESSPQHYLGPSGLRNTGGVPLAAGGSSPSPSASTQMQYASSPSPRPRLSAKSSFIGLSPGGVMGGDERYGPAAAYPPYREDRERTAPPRSSYDEFPSAGVGPGGGGSYPPYSGTRPLGPTSNSNLKSPAEREYGSHATLSRQPSFVNYGWDERDVDRERERGREHWEDEREPYGRPRELNRDREPYPDTTGPPGGAGPPWQHPSYPGSYSASPLSTHPPHSARNSGGYPSPPSSATRHGSMNSTVDYTPHIYDDPPPPSSSVRGYGPSYRPPPDDHWDYHHNQQMHPHPQRHQTYPPAQDPYPRYPPHPSNFPPPPHPHALPHGLAAVPPIPIPQHSHRHDEIPMQPPGPTWKTWATEMRQAPRLGVAEHQYLAPAHAPPSQRSNEKDKGEERKPKPQKEKKASGASSGSSKTKLHATTQKPARKGKAQRKRDDSPELELDEEDDNDDGVDGDDDDNDEEDAVTDDDDDDENDEEDEEDREDVTASPNALGKKQESSEEESEGNEDEEEEDQDDQDEEKEDGDEGNDEESEDDPTSLPKSKSGSKSKLKETKVHDSNAEMEMRRANFLEELRKLDEEIARKEKYLQEKMAEQAQRIEAERIKEEALARKEEEAKKKEKDIRKRETESKKINLETKRKESDLKKMEEETRQREQKAKEDAERAMELQQEAERIAGEAKKRQENLDKLEKESRRKEEEINSREAALCIREEEMKKREADAKRKEDEAKRKVQQDKSKEDAQRKDAEAKIRREEAERRRQDAALHGDDPEFILEQQRLLQQAQQDHYRKVEEDMKRNKEGKRKNENLANNDGPWTSSSPGIPQSAAGTAKGPQFSAGSWGHSTASAWASSTKPATASSSPSANSGPRVPQGTSPLSSASGKQRTGSVSSGSAPSTGSFTSTGASPGATNFNTTFSEADHKRRLEDLMREQQEKFMREQEMLEGERQKRAGNFLSLDEQKMVFEQHGLLWNRLSTSSNSSNKAGDLTWNLTWNDVPWPMPRFPHTPEDISYTLVSAYFKSPAWPDAKSSKERLKEHLKRWHPDRFDTIVLPRVVESEKATVQKGAGNVTRILNELLTKERD